MAQPRTQAELIASLRDQYQRNPAAVVSTIATKTMDQLPPSQKDLANAYLRTTLTSALNLDAALPGQELVVRSQTDEWYRRHDPSKGFTGLVAHIVTVAVRTR